MTEGHAPERAELLPQRGHVIAPPQPPLSRQEAGAKVESLFKTPERILRRSAWS